MNFPLVTIAILNWNGRAFLQQFLPSVLETQYPNLQILLIDNASTDDSVAFVKQHFPSLQITINAQNYGYADGYNKGLKNIKSDYFILLNSDIEVDKNWVQPLIALMETAPNIAVVQPQILAYADKNSFEHAGAAGGFLDNFGFPFCRGRIFNRVEKNQQQYEQSTEIFWASGAAFCIRQSDWLESGGLDGDFFAHMEEIDLCWRLKNKGKKIMYCPQSQIFHVGGGTLDMGSPFKNYLNFRNNLWMLQKNLPQSGRIFKIFIRMSIDFIAWLRFICEGKFKHAFSVNKAHWHFLKSIAKTEQKRTLKNPNFPTQVYRKSIVWAFYAQGKKKFSDLKTTYFS